MTKSEFVLYISKDNSGFYKTRRNHINKVAPEILEEVNNHILRYNLSPINFNDSVHYYLNDLTNQVTCKMCGKIIYYRYQYCSNECKKNDLLYLIGKTQQTLLKRYGTISPLGSKEAKEKKKQTCLEKYGVEHPSSNEDIKNKIKESNIETYKDPEVRKKLGKIISLSYKEHGEERLEKRKQTNFERTGEYRILTTASINKAQNTFEKKYGTRNPFAIHKDTYELARLGSIKFFSDENNKNKSIEKRIKTIINKYGSIEKMNEYVFYKNKNRIINKLNEDNIKDEIILYEYNKLGFVKCKGFNCEHEYEISLHLLRDRSYRNDICCTICSPPHRTQSSAQLEIFNWISQYIECEQNNRKILNGSEIDIFIPSKNLGIEYNGIYWHSDLFKDKNYHLNKTLFLKNENMQLIHIWEDLWKNKKDIVKNRILSKLNINQKNIDIKKCVIQEINIKEANIFYELNHLQDKTNTKINIALILDNEIISCLSIKNNKNNYEILRFCNKLGISCISSFSKLFKYTKNKYIGNYISYIDLCWGEGNVYKYAGFKLREFSKPNYWYFVGEERFYKNDFIKRKLIKMGYDKNKTEFEIMDNDIKALRIYDCGNAIWEYIKHKYK